MLHLNQLLLSVMLTSYVPLVQEYVQKIALLKQKEKNRDWGVKRFIFFVQVTGKEVPHDPSWSLPAQVYVVIHFLLVLRTYHDVFENKMVCICHIRKTVDVNIGKEQTFKVSPSSLESTSTNFSAV